MADPKEVRHWDAEEVCGRELIHEAAKPGDGRRGLRSTFPEARGGDVYGRRRVALDLVQGDWRWGS